jgi:hypothetical protein
MRELALNTLMEPAAEGEAVGTGSISGAGSTSGAGSKTGEGLSPFILGEALPVVPPKLVRKILRGEFVDMAELLRDNMEAERRRAGMGSEATPRASRREIPDMLSWLHCFSLYAAVVGSRYPEKMKDLLAYQALMIAEHRRCGGRGWLLYDSAFRQQISSLETADFSRINQSLYLTTFVAYGGKGQCCPNCLLSDHTQDECALQSHKAAPGGRGESSGELGRSQDDRGRRRRKGACFAWNSGKCFLPYCRFDHVCSRCHGEHRKAACKWQVDVERGGGPRARGQGK